MSYGDLTAANAVYADVTQAHLDDAQIYLDARYSPWPGVLAVSTQINNWPRTAADGSALTDVDGREISTVFIPAQITRAELEVANLIEQGKQVLPVDVATASSTSATVGGQITHKEVVADTVKTVTKYSADSSETSTGAAVQQIDSNGFAIIKFIDAIVRPLVGSSSSSNNYRILRA